MFPWCPSQEEPPAWDRFETVELARGLDRPLELAVANDGRVFFIELGGKLRVWRPRTRDVVEAGELQVFADQENGLIGLALDPDFARNGWLYLLHSPRDFSGQHLSRFTVDGDRIEPSSEKVLLAFEEQRQECCHHAGSLAFGPDGCLFVATGDNTNPAGDSEGYAPIDERDGRAPFDALRGSANTQSLTGKILRIRPTASGGYDIPAGNLFPHPSAGRPEIYVMGCRNPWRISVDPASGFLYWGEVGPDAGADGARGPKGYDELNQARAAGNFGWPLFIADNKPYASYDYVTKSVGPPFDVAHPLNASRYNTGARDLPPPQPAWIFYPYDGSKEFPELDAPGGRTACAGPVFHFDPKSRSETQFPAALDGRLFVYEWSRHWIKTVALGPHGERGRIEPFLPDQRFVRPVDMQFGPEGSLYLLEYGTTWGTNADSRLVRIDYHAGNRAPIPHISAQGTIGHGPLVFRFSHDGTSDPDGDVVTCVWHTVLPTGERMETPEKPEGNYIINLAGVWSLELEVTDPFGAKARASVPLLVGNSPPELAFEYPRDGGFFDPAQPLHVHVALSDLEDDADDSPQGVAAELARASISARFVAGPPDGASDMPDPPGLALMKRADCFNCHALDHRIVGPSLREIAARSLASHDAGGTLASAAKRVREGSTGVWGSPAMLPHPQHSDDELRTMVAWILALRDDDAPAALLPGLGGELAPLAGAGQPAPSGVWLLEARYTDAGAGPIGPLTASASVRVRTLTVEAEHANSRRGTQTLESKSASGGRFVGAIDHGNFLRFAGVDLAGIASVVCRVSSAGSGATVSLHADAPDGATLGSFEMKPNGAWEDWFEVEVPLCPSSGLHDLYVVFENAANPSGLMNLDCMRFVPASMEPSGAEPGR